MKNSKLFLTVLIASGIALVVGIILSRAGEVGPSAGSYNPSIKSTTSIGNNKELNATGKSGSIRYRVPQSIAG